MRQRKNGVASSPIHEVLERADELALDAAYAAVNAALRQWRRDPSSTEAKTALVTAFDAREDALAKVVDEDLRLEAAAAVSQVHPSDGGR